MQGKPLYDFSLASTGGITFQRSALRAAKGVLYFYPNDSHALFRRAGTRLFKQKIRVPFEPKEKLMYGKKVRGIPKGLRAVSVPGHAQEVLNFVKAL